MSTFGVTSVHVLPLASALAGGQQARPDQNQATAAAAQRDFQQTLAALTAKASGDVDTADLNSERDADGRTPFDGSQGHAAPDATASGAEGTGPVLRRPVDPDSDLGHHLDLDA